MDLITEHLDLWTSTIKAKKTTGRGSSKKQELYGIKKLRELILELAVRGLLVPQDANDEPASGLIKKIKEEKAGLIKEGHFKRQKNISKSTDEYSFRIASKWEWTNLDAISDINGGFAFKSANYEETGTRVIRISDFDEQGLKTVSYTHLTLPTTPYV